MFHVAVGIVVILEKGDGDALWRNHYNLTITQLTIQHPYIAIRN